MIKITTVDHFLLRVPFVEQLMQWVPMDWPSPNTLATACIPPPGIRHSRREFPAASALKKAVHRLLPLDG